jgi:photosynthetic reaction center cytochrome c subunit
LKHSSSFHSALVAAACCAAFAVASVAQEPPHEHPTAPAPTNLQVLPKTMTGEQVHQVMHKWAASLGTECTTCHAADPAHKAPNGHPMLKVRMVEEINSQYIGKLDSAQPVTCATCHRGHLEPPEFVPPPDHDHHDHAAPAGGEKPPAGR